MSDKNYSEAIAFIQWNIEKYWEANEGMMKRASTFIGLLGVELSFLVNLSAKEIKAVDCALYSLVLAAFAIAGSIWQFFESLRDKVFEFPRFSKLSQLMNIKSNELSSKVMEYILSEDEPEKGLYQNLHRENKHISRYFSRGINLAIFGQFLLLVTLLFNWFG